MTSQLVTIKNKLGLHARASSNFVKIASRFQSEITLKKDGTEANGKSILGIMSMAVAYGSELVIEALGQDETEAIEALKTLVDDRFGEEE